MAEIIERPTPVIATAKDIAKRVFRHGNVALGLVLMVLVAGLAGMTRGLTVREPMSLMLYYKVRRGGIASIGQLFYQKFAEPLCKTLFGMMQENCNWVGARRRV